MFLHGEQIERDKKDTHRNMTTKAIPITTTTTHLPYYYNRLFGFRFLLIRVMNENYVNNKK